MSGFRVLQLMPGIGATTAEGILDQLEITIGDASLAEVRVPPRAAEHWAAFVQVFERLQRGTAGWPAEIEAVRLWYEPHLEAARAGDLVQLVRIADGFASRMSFLTELTLDPPQATSDLAGAPLQDEDYLILSTIHSAKGQEWRAVFVLNCVDGCIPSDLATGTPEEIEEERRLFYVAMTRAKDALHLIVPGASTPTARPHAATGTSTRPGAGSYRATWPTGSRSRPGSRGRATQGRRRGRCLRGTSSSRWRMWA